MPRSRRIWRVIGIVAGSLLAAAIVVPNLIRSNIACNCSGPDSNLRTLGTTEVTYTMTYPEQGYAPNLAVLGVKHWFEPEGGPSIARAWLIDPVLGCAEGTGIAWCVKDEYRYNIQSSDSAAPYRDYWITATPTEELYRRALEDRKPRWTDRFYRRSKEPLPKNYCVTEEVQITVEEGPPRSVPYTKEECSKLPLLSR